MRHLRMKAAHEGCKEGDVVAFENIEEAKALVAADKAEEVRHTPEGWVVVNRVDVNVTDSFGATGGGAA